MPPRVSRRLLAFQLRLDVLGHHTDLFHGRLQLIRRAAKFPRPVLHLVVFVYIDAIRVLAAATGIQRCDRTFLSPSAGPGRGGGGGGRLGREPRVLAKRDSLCVLAQPVAEGVAVENDLLARILQVSLAPELIHVVCDDFARRAHILREQFVGKRRHADRAILLHRAQAFRETDQRAGQAACDVVHTEALDAVREIDGALHQDLQQRHSQAGTLREDVLDLGGGPRHQLGVFQSRGLLAAVRQIQQCGLAKKLVGLVHVDNHMVAVVGHTRDFDFALDDQVDVGGRLVLIVDHLAFLVLHDAGAGQMREGIFECFLRCKDGGAGCHFVSSKNVYFSSNWVFLFLFSLYDPSTLQSGTIVKQWPLSRLNHHRQVGASIGVIGTVGCPELIAICTRTWRPARPAIVPVPHRSKPTRLRSKSSSWRAASFSRRISSSQPALSASWLSAMTSARRCDSVRFASTITGTSVMPSLRAARRRPWHSPPPPAIANVLRRGIYPEGHLPPQQWVGHAEGIWAGCSASVESPDTLTRTTQTFFVSCSPFWRDRPWSPEGHGPLSSRSHLGCGADGMPRAAWTYSSGTGKGQRTVLAIESVVGPP